MSNIHAILNRVCERRAAAREPHGPTLEMGGLRIAVADRLGAARLLDLHGSSLRRADRLPLVVTSANGEVLSKVAGSSRLLALFRTADIIHADGQAMVTLSRLWHRTPLPERVATTDLFHDVARLAERSGTSFYLLGATPDAILDAVANVRRLYPRLNLAGFHHGYIDATTEAMVVQDIARLRPGILWVGMGIPREQAFALRNKAALRGVGVVKTAGGLFDFLAGHKTRAPRAMQRMGLEWLWRAMLEPRRLGPRYLLTNPHALLIMLRGPRRLAPEPRAAGFEALRP